jgi:hypothetical protein
MMSVVMIRLSAEAKSRTRITALFVEDDDDKSFQAAQAGRASGSPSDHLEGPTQGTKIHVAANGVRGDPEMGS